MEKTKRPANRCCVLGCSGIAKDSSRKIKFYRFPVRKHCLEKRAKWIKALRRVNVDGSLWEPSPTSRICSQHFVGGEKSEHPHSPAFLPTIFPEKYYGKQKSTEAAQLRAQNRFVRAMRRCQNSNDPQIKNIQQFIDTGEFIVKQESTDIIMQPPEQQFCESALQVDFYEDELTSAYVEADVENEVKNKLVGGKMILKSKVLPHRIDCRPVPKHSEPRPAVKKSQQIEVFENILTKNKEEGPGEQLNSSSQSFEFVSCGNIYSDNIEELNDAIYVSHINKGQHTG